MDSGLDIRANRLHESEIRQGERALLVAVADKGRAAIRPDVAPELPAESGLADARLPPPPSRAILRPSTAWSKAAVSSRSSRSRPTKPVVVKGTEAGSDSEGDIAKPGSRIGANVAAWCWRVKRPAARRSGADLDPERLSQGNSLRNASWNQLGGLAAAAGSLWLVPPRVECVAVRREVSFPVSKGFPFGTPHIQVCTVAEAHAPLLEHVFRVALPSTNRSRGVKQCGSERAGL